MAYRSFIFGTPDDGSYCGFTGTFTAGENLTKWQCVYMAANGKVYKARGNATGTLPPLGLAVANALADAAVVVLVWGKARNVAGWNWTLGAGVAGLVYVDPDTAGALIQGDPNTVFDEGETAAIVGFAFDGDTLFVVPNTTTVTKGAAVSGLSTVTSLPTDGNYTAFKPPLQLTAGTGGLTKYQVAYISGNAVVLPAKGDVSTTMPGFGLVTANAAQTDPVVLLTEGLITNSSWTWTANDKIYVSAATAGLLTATAPTSGQYAQVVALAVNATCIYFFNTRSYFLVQ